MFEPTAEEDIRRDGGAQTETPSAPGKADTRDKFYRSQKEVDSAFKKRFAALKEKWESEQKDKQKSRQAEQRISSLIETIENQSQEFSRQYPDVDIFSVIEQNPLFAYLVMAGKDLIDVYEFLYADNIRQKNQTRSGTGNHRQHESTQHKAACHACRKQRRFAKRHRQTFRRRDPEDRPAHQKRRTRNTLVRSQLSFYTVCPFSGRLI